MNKQKIFLLLPLLLIMFSCDESKINSDFDSITNQQQVSYTTNPYNWVGEQHNLILEHSMQEFLNNYDAGNYSFIDTTNENTIKNSIIANKSKYDSLRINEIKVGFINSRIDANATYSSTNDLDGTIDLELFSSLLIGTSNHDLRANEIEDALQSFSAKDRYWVEQIMQTISSNLSQTNPTFSSLRTDLLQVKTQMLNQTWSPNDFAAFAVLAVSEYSCNYWESIYVVTASSSKSNLPTKQGLKEAVYNYIPGRTTEEKVAFGVAVVGADAGGAILGSGGGPALAVTIGAKMSGKAGAIAGSLLQAKNFIKDLFS